MSGVFPEPARGSAPEPEHPRLHQRPRSQAEERSHREVRAAAWRAREIAELVFGGARTSLKSLRAQGPIRGLLRLDVPFVSMERHEDGRLQFMAAVETDPVLSRVGLVYVIGPEGA